MKTNQIGGTTVSHLGYGCMRLPVNGDGSIDMTEMKSLIRHSMENGITYFDTAWTYHARKSESALGEALASFPRESYRLATKLPCAQITSVEQAIECFHTQLDNLRTDYIDFYLLHAVNRVRWKNMVELGVVAALEGLKKQGKIRHFGFSFHDSYDTFEEVLSFRDWDFCQIQLNYLDTGWQAGMRGYKLASERGIPVVVMEPLKGGMLAQLPKDLAEPLTALDPNVSHASWGMRWLASQPNVKVVLSGMTTMDQLVDNLATFKGVKPLDERELEAVEETTRLLRQRLKNDCTACRYCLPCPVGVDIPNNFRVWNIKSVFDAPKEVARLWGMLNDGARAHSCVGCGKCETLCPQMLPIRAHLQGLSEEVDNYLKERL